MSEEKQLRKGQFGHPETTQRQGRPKGSKNRINALKLLAEQAVLEDNQPLLEQILTGILHDARDGDNVCRKMVWEAIMSKGLSDTAKTTEKVTIQIGSTQQDSPKDIEGTAVIVADEEEESDEAQPML